MGLYTTVCSSLEEGSSVEVCPCYQPARVVVAVKALGKVVPKLSGGGGGVIHCLPLPLPYGRKALCEPKEEPSLVRLSSTGSIPKNAS